MCVIQFLYRREKREINRQANKYIEKWEKNLIKAGKGSVIDGTSATITKASLQKVSDDVEKNLSFRRKGGFQ